MYKRQVQESTNIAALKAACVAGLAVGVFQDASVAGDAVRILTAADGFPALPEAEVRMQTAERYLPRAAVRLHEFLCRTLIHGAGTTPDKAA